MPRRVTVSPPPNENVIAPEALMQQVRSLLAEAQALSSRLAALNEVAVAVQASLDTEEILRTFARESRWVIDYQLCSISLREGDLYTERVLQVNTRDETSLWQRGLSEGAIGRVLSEGQALIIDALREEDAAPEGMRSALLLPLRNAGAVIGTLNFYARTEMRYSTDDLRIAYALAIQIAAIIHNARLFRAATRARDELTTVLESIHDAVIVIDRDGQIVLCNPSLGRMLGVSHEAMVGRAFTRLGLCRARNGRRLLALGELRQFAAAYQSQSSGLIHFSDGRTVEWAISPFVSAELEGVVLTGRDVSDRVLLEELRDDMIGMLVHDLRTPLASIMMGLDLLRIYNDDQSSQADVADVVQRIRWSANRMLQQVNTLLDLRKLEAGRMGLDPSITTVRNLVTRTIEPLLPLIAQSSQTLSYEFAADLPAMMVDHSVISRVLENLLGNAQKFTPTGGTIVVRARTIANGTQIEVSVCDSGPGVPASQREYIFEKYGQANREHSRKGTGLGLYFCKMAIEAHGGRIGVNDLQPRGSEFWFTLPVINNDTIGQSVFSGIADGI